MTLLERLFLELVYFLSTMKHLDVRNRTLCVGSRDKKNGVPHVRWCNDDTKDEYVVDIYWCSIDGFNEDLRSRTIMGLPVEP